jgi:hypothetical protein
MTPLVFVAPGIYRSPLRPMLFLDIPLLTVRRSSTRSPRAEGRRVMAEIRASGEMDRFVLVSRLRGIPHKPQL